MTNHSILRPSPHRYIIFCDSPHLSILMIFRTQRSSVASRNSKKMALEGRLAIIAGGLGMFGNILIHSY